MENQQRILVIEDDASLRNALRDKLTLEGFSVLEAQDGEEGYAVALREHPDLILLDIVMPVMDGITMLQKVREDAWGTDAKVIILTNLSDNEKVAEALAQKSYDFLVKSNWKIADVVEKIKQRLGHSS
jgi:DNA-binding response OmpR family regulator